MDNILVKFVGVVQALYNVSSEYKLIKYSSSIEYCNVLTVVELTSECCCNDRRSVYIRLTFGITAVADHKGGTDASVIRIVKTRVRLGHRCHTDVARFQLDIHT